MTSQLDKLNLPHPLVALSSILQETSIIKNDTCCMCGVKFDPTVGPFPHESIYVKEDIIWRCEPCSVKDPKGEELFKVLITKGYQDAY